MADEAAPNGGAAPTNQPPPKFSIQAQYVKDLSFENPRAPQGLTGQTRPEIQIQVDVRTKKIDNERHEIVLHLNVNAKAENETVFLVELTYGGVFALANIPDASLQPLLMIECPRLLFPFARRIVADTTRDGGLPPLMIDPIDFVQLYRRKLKTAQDAAAAAKVESPVS